jgi:hypothetical protein
MGPPALFPIREEGVLRIFIALKNPSPWPGLNPRLCAWHNPQSCESHTVWKNKFWEEVIMSTVLQIFQSNYTMKSPGIMNK